MKKRSVTLKRYIYVSSQKIEHMFDQRRRLPPLVRGVLGFLNKVKIQITFVVGQLAFEAGTSPNVTEMEKMRVVVATLEREHPIGTVDAPAEYIKDTLLMFYRLIPSRPRYRRRKNDPGLLYFGGSTSQTVIALVGSPFHLVGKVKDISEESSSDLPYLIAYLNEHMGELINDERYKVTDHGIAAIEHADKMNKDPRRRVEFFAARILDSADIPGFTPTRRLLVYTPYYVAYASDSLPALIPLHP